MLKQDVHKLQTDVLIIGGGVTGTGIARDLSLRGVPCMLAEKMDINAGASGGNHGLLHSGARYVASDADAAVECRIEGEILKRIAPHCIEETGGLFVAVAGDDESYLESFPGQCRNAGIAAQPVGIEDARKMEPALSSRLIAAYLVPDASVDPFRLSLENLSDARDHGCSFFKHFEVVRFILHNNRIQATTLKNRVTGEECLVEADQVVSAAGAWANHIGSLAGIPMEMIYSKGTLIVTSERVSTRVINRLRPPADSDIIVPGGTVSIIGTTSVRIDSPDKAYPTSEEVDQIVAESTAMLPCLASTRFIRAYSGVRPLMKGSPDADDRQVTRGFALLDHSRDGVDNFITITGGKLSTYRLMAEKAADLVCRRLAVSTPCETATRPLPATGGDRWTEPGIAPKLWLQQNNPSDSLLCECEMVPESAVEQICQMMKQDSLVPEINAIALRSRIGKGPCQGTFCSLRLAAYLYDHGLIHDNDGIRQLLHFIQERWRGQHPLLWDQPLAQAELMDAVHSGTFGLDLHPRGIR